MQMGNEHGRSVVKHMKIVPDIKTEIYPVTGSSELLLTHREYSNTVSL